MAAAIMCAAADDHSVMGGSEGAMKWLVRFISALPRAPAQLPIITAPVLVAFLTAAGHMLARKHPAEFKKLIYHIVNDIVPRVDDGSLGAPSLVRLKKTIHGGFQHFELTLPKGAIPELYVGSDAYIGSVCMEANSTENVPTFGATTFSATRPQEAANPFVTQTSSESSYSPFPRGGMNINRSPFGATEVQQQPASAGTPLGSFPQSAQAISSASPFQNITPSHAPAQWGVGTTSPSPFSVLPSATANPFRGGGQLAPTIQALNPFVSSQGNKPFGGNGGGSSFRNGNPGGSNRRPAPLCKFFIQGKCRNGAYCKFSHDINPNEGGAGATFGFSPSGGGDARSSTPFGA